MRNFPQKYSQSEITPSLYREKAEKKFCKCLVSKYASKFAFTQATLTVYTAMEVLW